MRSTWSTRVKYAVYLKIYLHTYICEISYRKWFGYWGRLKQWKRSQKIGQTCPYPKAGPKTTANHHYLIISYPCPTDHQSAVHGFSYFVLPHLCLPIQPARLHSVCCLDRIFVWPQIRVVRLNWFEVGPYHQGTIFNYASTYRPHSSCCTIPISQAVISVSINAVSVGISMTKISIISRIF